MTKHIEEMEYSPVTQRMSRRDSCLNKYGKIFGCLLVAFLVVSAIVSLTHLTATKEVLVKIGDSLRLFESSARASKNQTVGALNNITTNLNASAEHFKVSLTALQAQQGQLQKNTSIIQTSLEKIGNIKSDIDDKIKVLEGRLNEFYRLINGLNGFYENLQTQVNNIEKLVNKTDVADEKTIPLSVQLEETTVAAATEQVGPIAI